MQAPTSTRFLQHLITLITFATGGITGINNSDRVAFAYIASEGAIATVNGNSLGSFLVNIDTSNAPQPDTQAPLLSEEHLPTLDGSGNSFSLSFDEQLDASGSTLDSNAFSLYVDGVLQSIDASGLGLSLDASGSAINVTLPSTLELYNDSQVLIAYSSNNAGILQDSAGNQVNSFITEVNTSSLTNYRDNTAPTLNSGNPYIDAFGSSFSLSFDEQLDASGSTLDSNAFSLYVDGVLQSIDASGLGLSLDASGSAINVTLPSTLELYNDSQVLIAYSSNNAGILQDSAGNQSIPSLLKLIHPH